MKKAIFIFLLIPLSFSFAKNEKISTFDAIYYVNQEKMVCGNLAEVVQAKKRVLLNFDKTYPNQLFTVLIWDDNYPKFLNKFGDLNHLVGRRFCAQGVIKSYKNQLETEVSNPIFLRLMK